MSTHVGDLQLDNSIEGQVLRVKMSGQADLKDGGALCVSLLELHQQAVTNHADDVRVDLKDVEFMNSTALGAFVKWMSALLSMDEASRYRVVLEGTRARRWQRISLHALASFAPQNISVVFTA